MTSSHLKECSLSQGLFRSVYRCTSCELMSCSTSTIRGSAYTPMNIMHCVSHLIWLTASRLCYSTKNTGNSFNIKATSLPWPCRIERSKCYHIEHFLNTASYVLAQGYRYLVLQSCNIDSIPFVPAKPTAYRRHPMNSPMPLILQLLNPRDEAWGRERGLSEVDEGITGILLKRFPLEP